MSTSKRRSLIRKPRQVKTETLDALDAIEFGSDLDGFVDDDDSDEYEIDDDEVVEATLQVRGLSGGYATTGDSLMPIDASVMDEVTGGLPGQGNALGVWDEIPQDPGDIDARFGTPISVRRVGVEADEVTEVADPPEAMPDLPTGQRPRSASQPPTGPSAPGSARPQAQAGASGKKKWFAAMGMSIGVAGGGAVLLLVGVFLLNSVREARIAELTAAPTQEQPPITAPVVVDEDEEAVEELVPEEEEVVEAPPPVRSTGPKPAPVPEAEPEAVWDGAPDNGPAPAPEPVAEPVPDETDKKGLFKKKKK